MASYRSQLSVRLLQESEYQAWDDFVRATPAGTIYSLTAYLDTLCRATNGRFRVVVVEKGDEPVGGCALYERQTAHGTIAANRLLLYFHPVVVREYDTQYPSERTARHLAILETLESWLRQQPYDRVILHCRNLYDVRPFYAAGWGVTPSYTYEIAFDDLETAHGRIEQNLRRLIKRAEREGLGLTEDDDFDSFFKLHHEVHSRKNAPLYLPREPFARYVRDLRAASLGRLYHARLKSGESVASQLVLTGPFKMTHTVCAGAHGAYLKIGTTPFLRWKVCEDLHLLGYTGNDLTDAALNEVTRFKSQLGGELRQNFVLKRPDSSRFTWYSRYLAGRSLIGAAARKLLGRG